MPRCMGHMAPSPDNPAFGDKAIALLRRIEKTGHHLGGGAPLLFLQGRHKRTAKRHVQHRRQQSAVCCPTFVQVNGLHRDFNRAVPRTPCGHGQTKRSCDSRGLWRGTPSITHGRITPTILTNTRFLRWPSNSA